MRKVELAEGTPPNLTPVTLKPPEKKIQLTNIRIMPLNNQPKGVSTSQTSLMKRELLSEKVKNDQQRFGEHYSTYQEHIQL